MRIHTDDRAQRLCDVFNILPNGDVNVSYIYPGNISAWHKHKNQTDYQICIKGSLKIGMCNFPEYEKYVFHDNPTVIVAKKREAEWQKMSSEWKEYRKYCLEELSKCKAGTTINDIERNLRIVANEWSDEPEVRWIYVSDKNLHTQPIIIPKMLWHGSMNFTNEESILLYYITQKYNPKDEYRLDVKSAGWDWYREIK